MTALGVDHHVADLAGEPVPSAQQRAAGHDPAADTHLADEDQDVVADAVGGGAGLGDRGEVGLVVDEHRARRAPEPVREQLGGGHVAPAEVRSEGEHAGCAVHETGQPEGEADRLRRPVVEVLQGAPDEGCEPVEHGSRVQVHGVE